VLSTAVLWDAKTMRESAIASIRLLVFLSGRERLPGGEPDDAAWDVSSRRWLLWLFVSSSECPTAADAAQRCRALQRGLNRIRFPQLDAGGGNASYAEFCIVHPALSGGGAELAVVHALYGHDGSTGRNIASSINGFLVCHTVEIWELGFDGAGRESM